MWRSICLAVITSLALSACTTAMWQHRQHQTFWIDGFYIKRDTGQLYVTARDDTFVFDIDPAFARVMEMTFHLALDPEFYGFRIDERHRITGHLTLSPRRVDLSAAEQAQLEANGFRKAHNGEWRFRQPLEGRRYMLKGEFPLAKLDREYPVDVEVPDAYLISAGKIVATPVMLVMDALVTIPITAAVFGIISFSAEP